MGSLFHRGRNSRSKQIEAELALARRDIRNGRFQRTMAVITAFSALVSGFETYTQHERGAFDNKLMWTPVALTPPLIVAGGAAVVSERAARRVLPFLSLVSLADGVIGFVYHLKGIARMPGGFRRGQYNVVMGPPVFAPLLTCVVGVTGLLCGGLRRERLTPAPPAERAIERVATTARQIRGGLPGQFEAEVATGEFQQVMALTAALFAVLAGGEAYFEHLRGSFNQRLMWTPIWVAPPMALAAIGAVFSRRIAHIVLPFAAAVTFFDGLLGFCLHLRGVKRMPGQFRNFKFNITMGPPLFAPLLFCSVGLLGLIAALLRRGKQA
jgi:hypothetical protein